MNDPAAGQRRRGPRWAPPQGLNSGGTQLKRRADGGGSHLRQSRLQTPAGAAPNPQSLRICHRLLSSSATALTIVRTIRQKLASLTWKQWLAIDAGGLA